MGVNREKQAELPDPAAHGTFPRRGHLTKGDTELYKGIGILLIVLHNYFHWVKPNPGENEFTFSSDRTVNLLAALNEQPLESLNLFFSYFGHYGVQLFVFLSAYGLTRAYGGKRLAWTPFVCRRVARLYPTFVLAVLAHALLVVTPWSDSFVWFLKLYALKLSLLSAFYPEMQFAPVGPWWFFSMIFQFYAVYLALDRVAIRYGAKGMLIAGVSGLVITVLGNAYLVPSGINLYCTVIGHLPVLCLGMWFARRESLEAAPSVVALAAVFFVLGMWFEAFWYLAPVSVTLLLLAGVPSLLGRLRKWKTSCCFVRFCGEVSLPLFAIHPIMRAPFVDAANDWGAWYITVALAIAFLVCALAAATVSGFIEDVGRRWVSTRVAARS